MSTPRLPPPVSPKVPIPWWAWAAAVINLSVALVAPPGLRAAFGILGVGAAITCLQIGRAAVIPADRRRNLCIGVTLVCCVAGSILRTQAG